MGEPAVATLEQCRAHTLVDQRLVLSGGGRTCKQQRQRCANRDGGAARGVAEPDQNEAADHAGGAKRQRDRACADHWDQIEGGAEGADDGAEGRHAVDGARHRARAQRRAQHQADRERRIHPEEGDRKQEDGNRSDETAGAHVVDVLQQEFEHRLGEIRQHQHVDRADQHGAAQHAGRWVAVGEPAAEEIAERQGHQHGRDQRGPGVDAAAEIGVEIARAEHLEAHDDRAGHEGDDVDQDGGHGDRCAGNRGGRGDGRLGRGFGHEGLVTAEYDPPSVCGAAVFVALNALAPTS